MKQLCADNAKKSEIALTDSVDTLRAQHESRLDRLERLALEKDLVISGVPLESNDEPFAIVGDICGALNSDLKSGDFVSAFRLRSSTENGKNRRSKPIVVRVQDDWVKQSLLTAYFKKKNLNLTDIGFKFPARIYINERLTPANRAIFNRAAEAKKSDVIVRFYTRKGLVYIQRHANAKPIAVEQLSDLDRLLPTPYSTNKNLLDNRSINDVSGNNAPTLAAAPDGYNVLQSPVTHMETQLPESHKRQTV